MDQAQKVKLARWAAFGALGFYLYQVAQAKKQGLQGTNPEGFKFQLQTDRIVDSVMPWLALNPIHKELVRGGLKEFLKGLQDKP